MGARHMPSCCVNLVKGVFICHGCGIAGRLAKLVAKLENVSYKEAIGLVGGEARGRFKDQDAAVQLPEEYQNLPAVGRFASEAITYLQNRRITQKQIEHHQIGFCGTGKYARRIIVPITHEGKLINFIARDWTGRSERKVLNPPGSQAIRSVFGWDRACNYARSVVITEGWADALAVERVLQKDRYFSDWAALAIGGKEISDDKLLMFTKFEKFVVMLDSAARADAVLVGRKLTSFTDKIRIVKVSGKDPAETPEEEIMRLIR
jgi:DNA primase